MFIAPPPPSPVTQDMSELSPHPTPPPSPPPPAAASTTATHAPPTTAAGYRA